jgi:hypothetical protein
MAMCSSLRVVSAAWGYRPKDLGAAGVLANAEFVKGDLSSDPAAILAKAKEGHQ